MKSFQTAGRNQSFAHFPAIFARPFEVRDIEMAP